MFFCRYCGMHAHNVNTCMVTFRVAKQGAMCKDKGFVLPMVRMQVEMQGNALKFAADHLRADKKVVVAAVKESSDALEFVEMNAALWEDKALACSCCNQPAELRS